MTPLRFFIALKDGPSPRRYLARSVEIEHLGRDLRAGPVEAKHRSLELFAYYLMPEVRAL